MGDPTEKVAKSELASSCGTHRPYANVQQLHLFNKDPTLDSLSSWGPGSGLDSLVPVLGDALGVVGVI